MSVLYYILYITIAIIMTIFILIIISNSEYWTFNENHKIYSWHIILRKLVKFVFVNEVVIIVFIYNFRRIIFFTNKLIETINVINYVDISYVL